MQRRLTGDAVRAAGITSTPRDVARFFRELVSGGLLSERRTRELTELSVPVRYFPGKRFGLGVFSVRTPCGLAWGHRGRMDGYTTWAFATSDGERAVAASVNIGGLSQARVLRAEAIVRAALCA